MGVYDIICLQVEVSHVLPNSQSLWKEATHEALIAALSSHNYNFLLSGELTKSRTLLPGLFFASTLPIIRWEYESFTLLSKSYPIKGLLSGKNRKKKKF